MPTLSDLLNKGFEFFDNRNQREFEIDLAEAQARTQAVLNATQVPQNANATLAGFSTKQLQVAGLGAVGLLLLALVAVRVMD